jgi:hypothetical protein
MHTAIYHIPALDLAEAVEVAHAAHAGRLKHVEHYLCPEAAARVCGHLNRDAARPRRVYPVAIELRTHHDGRIPVAWPVDAVGDIAAAITLFCILPALAAHFWSLLA